jgi:hypothetical protein
MTATTKSAVPLPAHAVEGGEWQVDGDNVTRPFMGLTRGDDKFNVCLFGEQDGFSAEVLDRAALFNMATEFRKVDAAGLAEHIDHCLAVLEELQP